MQIIYIGLFLVTVVSFGRGDATIDEAPDQSLVELIMADYLKVEHRFWMLLENRGDNALLQVYNAHERFLNKSLYETESGVFSNLFLPSNGLIEAARQINASAEQGYAHLTGKELDRRTVTEYAHNSLNVIEQARVIYNETSKAEFWEKFINHLKACHPSSDVIQSAHYVVYDHYKEIQAAFLKSYITAQMSYMILYYYEDKNIRSQSTELKTSFLEWTSLIRETARRYLHGSSKEVWVCDSSKYQDNRNYQQITNFLQGFVDNEANLNEEGTCTKTCSFYKSTRHFHCVAGSLCDDNGQKVPRCNGIVRNCEEIDDADLEICLDNSAERKINNIKRSDGSVMGRITGKCSSTIRSKSWTRWFVKCSNCICLCDDSSKIGSDKFFSLREAVSNVAANKVVTGVMLAKQDQIIQLVIAERTLLPFGQTDIHSHEATYQAWKTNENSFRVIDSGIVEGVDYHMLTYTDRAINLDTVTACKGQVVTGIRFRKVNGHLSLEIRSTEFDFKTGLLKNVDQSMWVTNPNSGKTPITLQKPTDPTAEPKILFPNHTPNSYIEFQPTDFWSDAAQYAVPFIDAIKLEPYVPVALSGIGLFYKGDAQSGFISPKLVVYDFESYLPESS